MVANKKKGEKLKQHLFIFILIILLKTDFIISKNIIILSIPKCGTHLAAKAVELITGKKLAAEVLPETILEQGLSVISDSQKLFRCHLKYDPRIRIDLVKNNFKGLFIFRDPRDQIISSAFWMKERLTKNKKFHNFTMQQLIDYQLKRLPLDVVLKYNTSDMLKLNPTNFNFSNMIDNLISRVSDYYYYFLKWREVKRIYTVKFENLVGKKGNGNDLLQKNEIRKICNYLGINSSEHIVNHCINNLYGHTLTFREGKIGSWKNYFTQEQINNFKKLAGQLLIDLGYEKDLLW